MVSIASYNCNSVRNNIETVRTLALEYDIILLQELMLLKEDIPFMNTIDNSFDCVACVEDRSNEGIIEGRPSKGVSIMWKKYLSSMVESVFCNDRIVGIKLNSKDKHYFIINVYLPCDKQNDDSLDEYRQSLAMLENFIADQNINNIHN